ncbi:MAG: penicillin-binding protein activator [Candidatus Desulfofervidaceae bacterium]|nr:penicillin-binding protein activator [Candidatus Desulfofervidaceae bacterium]
MNKFTLRHVLLCLIIFLNLFVSFSFAFEFWRFSRYRIGCLVPLSGDDERLGKEALKGLLLSLEILERHSSFTISVYDSGGKARQAVQAVEKMVEDGCDVAVALLGKKTARPTLVEAQQRRLPVIAMTAEPDIPTGGYIYRDFVSPEIQMENLVGFITTKLGFSSFAVLYPENEYGYLYLSLFEDKVKKYGGKIITAISYPAGISDFGTQIKKILGEEIVEAKPEEILTNSPSLPFEAVFIPDDVLTSTFIISQFAYYNVDNLVFLGTALWYDKKFIHKIRGYCKAVYFPTGFTSQASQPWVKEFLSDFQGHYSTPPNYLTAQAYEIGRVLIYLKKFNKLDIQNMHEYIQNFPGITGVTSFLPNGEVTKKIYIMKGENGAISIAP